jgi:hypothetical protein
VIAEFGNNVLKRKFIYDPGIDEPVRMTNVYRSSNIDGGGVGLSDLKAMAAAWLTETGQPGFNANADLNFDGKIYNSDSDILAANRSATSSSTEQHFYFHYDALGSVVALSDFKGGSVESYWQC